MTVIPVGTFFLVLRFPPKTDRHDITEILLKVEINTIKQSNSHPFGFSSVKWYRNCFQLFSDVFSNSINISKTNNHLSPHLSEHIKRPRIMTLEKFSFFVSICIYIICSKISWPITANAVLCLYRHL
jgi:hypothetical protein